MVKVPHIPERPSTPNLKIYEPHEYNAILAKQQDERGEERNIPKPTMSKAFVCTTKAPKMKDLRLDAQHRALNRGQPKAGKGKAGLPFGKLAGNESVEPE